MNTDRQAIWVEAERGSGAGLLRQPVSTLREIARHTDSAFAMFHDVAAEELSAFPSENFGRKFWLSLGYTEATSSKLAALSILGNFSAGTAVCANDFFRKNLGLNIHQIQDERVEHSDTSHSGLNEEFNKLNVVAKYYVLKSVCEAISLYCSNAIFHCLATNEPLRRSAIADKTAICYAAISLITIANSPVGVSAVNAESLATLLSRADDLTERYAAEFPTRYGLEIAEGSEILVIDAECAVAYSLLNLAESSVRSLNKGEANIAQEIASRFSDFENLLSQNRIEFDSRLAKNEISSFVLPPKSNDHWPSSIPEVEQVIRNILVSTTVVNPRNSLILESNSIGADLGAGKQIAIVAPNFTFSPSTENQEYSNRLRRCADSYPFFLWLAHPSTLGNEGAFSGSAYFKVAKKMESLKYSSDSTERAKYIRGKLAELAALGAGTAYSTPVIEALFPQLSGEAALAAAAVSSEVLVLIASQVVKGK